MANYDRLDNNGLLYFTQKLKPKVMGKTLTGTLSAGSTTLTLSDESIKTTSMLDIYTDVWGVAPTNVAAVTGSVTLTFESRQSALSVKVVVKEG